MRQLITAGQVLPGPAGERIEDGAVLLDGDTILAVGPRRELEQADIRRRDYPRHTVLPGLVNCHVHLAFDTSLDPVAALLDTDDVDLMLGMAGRAQQALRCGVTTIRDLGDRGGMAIRLRDAIARGELRGPRIFAAGPPLTIPRGHCWFFGGEVSGEAAIRHQVRHNAAQGADVIKVMASGGHMTPNSPAMWEPQFSTDELRIIVQEAAAVGLPVAAHAHGTESIAAAVEAGVDTVEHCTWMSAEGVAGGDRRDDVAKRMAERGIHACLAWSQNWREFIEKVGRERAQRTYGRVRWLDQLGVPLIVGTDAGLPRSMFDGLPTALELYVELGFTPDRVLEMATVTSATALGLSGTTGRLAPGMAADLLVVDGDPLADFSALHRLDLVLARGTAHYPERTD
jgi:imidazolonepropionase-like amidohydrolase